SLDAWTESLENAKQWGVRHLFVFSEQINPYHPPQGVTSDINGWTKQPARNTSPAERYANFLDGVSKVMEIVERTDMIVWLEALNTYHLQGDITINNHALAADTVRRINHPQFRMTFDCYHQQRSAGNQIQGLIDYRGLYDSVHVGDVPTRQEPGTGEINFHNIAKTLKALDYDATGAGLVGMEFTPSTTEAAALERVKGVFS
ncbi:MAG TPA: TIM barrel protein, partial [Anaerolineae bacterium]